MKPGDRADEAPGQQQTFTVTHPDLGERTVTQATWRREKLGKAGWQKPPEMPDEPDEGEGTVSGDTTPGE